MKEENRMKYENRRLVEAYLEHYNGMNIEPMLALFTDDAEFQSVSNTDGVVNYHPVNWVACIEPRCVLS